MVFEINGELTFEEFHFACRHRIRKRLLLRRLLIGVPVLVFMAYGGG